MFFILFIQNTLKYEIDFSGTKGFYLIKSLGHKIYQFWFEDSRDYEDFRANILAYKMSSSIKDDK